MPKKRIITLKSVALKNKLQESEKLVHVQNDQMKIKEEMLINEHPVQE